MFVTSLLILSIFFIVARHFSLLPVSLVKLLKLFYDHILHRFSRDYSLRKKALPNKQFFKINLFLFFSFSTGFLFFKKKKKCCVNLVKSRGSLFAIYYWNDYGSCGNNNCGDDVWSLEIVKN
jgi:hypothetical protein